MLCLIADIKTSVPEAGGMSPRCRDYLIDGSDAEAEIVIDADKYRLDLWPGMDDELSVYMESGWQFYTALLGFDGMMLHASATVIGGEVYLFAGQSGIGKSTHAELLKKLFPDALFINDDKPALRLVDGVWTVYGTPWSGKNFINLNAKYPLKAICLLTPRRDRNHICLADPYRAVAGLLSCTAGRGRKERALKLAPLIDRLLRDIPVYEMDSLADDAAARMAYNAMKYGMEP